eukprot:359236-Chlamydomonas_euryale.AAC.11
MKNVTEAPVTVEPAVSETLLSEADELMVLATDGLWDVMPPHDAMLIAQHKLRRGASPQEVADSLVRAALKRKSTDNVTVTVIDFKGAEYWAAAGAPPKSWLGQKMELGHVVLQDQNHAVAGRSRLQISHQVSGHMNGGDAAMSTPHCEK